MTGREAVSVFRQLANRAPLKGLAEADVVKEAIRVLEKCAVESDQFEQRMQRMIESMHHELAKAKTVEPKKSDFP